MAPEPSLSTPIRLLTMVLLAPSSKSPWLALPEIRLRSALAVVPIWSPVEPALIWRPTPFLLAGSAAERVEADEVTEHLGPGGAALDQDAVRAEPKNR